MIQLERLNSKPIYVNPDIIRYIESTPDVLLTFMDGQQLMVKESPQEIVQKIIAYRRDCFSELPKTKQS